MLGKTGLHAVKALAALARAGEGEYIGAAALSERIHSPRNYLGKLLQVLARAGLVEGQKGLNGGFRLTRKPGLISLYDVVDPIERVSRWNGCFLTHGDCRHDRACKAHGSWALVRDTYLRFLKETTILDIVDGSAPDAGLRRATPAESARRTSRTIPIRRLRQT